MHGDMDVPLIFLLIVRLAVTHSRTAIISKVPVRSGGSISIPCVYAAKYRNNVKYLCQGYYWSSCKDVVRTTSPRKPGKFSISDEKDQGIFTVNWENLGEANRYNWCIVEINGGSDDGEYFELAVSKGNPGLSVESQRMATSVREKLTIKCQHNGKGRMKWCRLHGTRRSCVDKTGPMDRASVVISDHQNVFTVDLTAQATTSSGWYYFDSGEFQMPVHVTVTEKQSTEKTPIEGVNETEIKSNNLLYYIIPLTTLIMIAMAALLIWFLYARQNRAKPQSSHINAEEEVTYTTVKHKKKTAGQPEEQDDNVTYSTLAYNGASSV